MTNVPSHYSISHDNAPNGLLAILEELSDSENVPTPFASIALFSTPANTSCGHPARTALKTS